MKKTIVGITVVGKDREGVVAQFTNFVFQNNANVEKVNQNVIKGLFGMYLEVSFTSKINFKQLDSGLQKLGKKTKDGSKYTFRNKHRKKYCHICYQRGSLSERNFIS